MQTKFQLSTSPHTPSADFLDPTTLLPSWYPPRIVLRSGKFLRPVQMFSVFTPDPKIDPLDHFGILLHAKVKSEKGMTLPSYLPSCLETPVLLFPGQRRESLEEVSIRFLEPGKKTEEERDVTNTNRIYSRNKQMLKRKIVAKTFGESKFFGWNNTRDYSFCRLFTSFFLSFIKTEMTKFYVVKNDCSRGLIIIKKKNPAES